MHELSLIALCWLCALGEPRELAARARFDVAFEIAEASVERLAADRPPDIVVVGAQGSVRSFRLARSEPEAAPTLVGPLGALELSDPRRCAVAWAPLERGGASQLFVASPRGVETFRAGADGVVLGPGTALAPRARLALRTGAPTAAPFAIDVNGDGRTDFVVPSGEKLDVWLRASGDGVRFERSVSVRVPRTDSSATDGADLSDVYRASLSIPSLSMRDIDGDGRADLVVEDGERRAFHRVRADGSIPESPDVELDLSIFKDTTPEGAVELGRTLASGGGARYQSRDLDSDGVPDAVIAHRRKVWVFRASKDGPQFTAPSTILKTDDDITALSLAELDDDGRPDLLLIKVQVPSLGEILRGLVASFSIEVAAIGYRNVGEGRFDPKPAWRGELSLRVPALLSLVRKPEAWIEKLEDAGKRFRRSIEGDFDGDGARDIALVSIDGATLEVWRGIAAPAGGVGETDRLLRRVLFDDAEREWDFDRLIAWIALLGEERARAATGERPFDARCSLRDAKAWSLCALLAGDLDGDARDEIVLRWSPIGATAGTPAASFDVLGW